MTIGILTGEAFRGRNGQADWLISRALDDPAVLTQRIAVKRDDLILAIRRSVMGHLHPELPGAEAHVYFGRLAPLAGHILDRPRVGRQTKLGSRGLVLIDVNSAKGSGNLSVLLLAILGLIHLHLTATHERNDHRQHDEYEDATLHNLFPPSAVRTPALPCSRKVSTACRLQGCDFRRLAA